MNPSPRGLWAVCLVLFCPLLASAAPDVGEQLYLERCAMCHQVTGTGVPPVYPPLAGSDFLVNERTRAIKALCEGLSGPINVKGQVYSNLMPAQMLNDQQAAAVLNHVAKSWGNSLSEFTPEEIATVRLTSKFATYDLLQKASAYAPLPKAPAGWAVREVAQLTEFCTRLASNGKGNIYAISQGGNIYRVDSNVGALELRFRNVDYLEPLRGVVGTTGFTQDAEGRLWVVCNRQLKEEEPVTNEVTIYRTDKPATEPDAQLKPWFITRYPYGVGPYNHGVSHLAFGPDGMLYINSGSRTDGGETGTNTKYYMGGEVKITACIWRLDPKAEHPTIEIFARGIRNAYGFTWDSAQRLFTFSNGPDANAPEEMDFVQQGKHYGFPYQFAEWPAEAGSPYAHTPAAPPDLVFTPPVRNLGPAGGGSAKGMYTFDPHSSPGGVVWTGKDFPAPYQNGFFVTRFGNLLGAPAAPVDVGFDLLWVKPNPGPRGPDTWDVRTETVLEKIGRPLDCIRSGPDAIWVLEYTRTTNYVDKLGWLPGRIIELKKAAP